MADRKFKEVNVDIFKIGPPSLSVISWTWETSVIPLSRYTIDIYRGESPEELELLSSNNPAETVSEFRDRTAQLVDKHRIFHYQVWAKNKNTGDTIKSSLVTREGGLDLVGLYIVEEHDFLFQYVSGTPVYVYKKQTSGSTRCDECWDSILKRVKRSNCQSCHGTGFVGKGVGGYYDPTYTWVDLSPDPEVVQVAQWGRVEPTQTDVFTSNYPRLSVGDLVVELTSDKRWKVMQVRDTEKRRTKMLQIARLDLINKDQVEYTIEIPESISKQARADLNDRKAELEF